MHMKRMSFAFPPFWSMTTSNLCLMLKSQSTGLKTDVVRRAEPWWCYSSLGGDDIMQVERIQGARKWTRKRPVNKAKKCDFKLSGFQKKKRHSERVYKIKKRSWYPHV